MIAVWVGLGLLVVLALSVVVSYNRFVRQRNLVQESWRQVDVELTRRHDLIPNLVETVKGYAAHERTVLSSVVEARNAAVAAQGSAASAGPAETALGGAVRGLFAVAENYPDLKAAGPFQQLQAQLAETEDRIAAGRPSTTATSGRSTPASRRSRPRSSPAPSTSRRPSTSRPTTRRSAPPSRSTSPSR